MSANIITLPKAPTEEIMGLLIKASSLLDHSHKHAILASDFDKMLQFIVWITLLNIS